MFDYLKDIINIIRLPPREAIYFQRQLASRRSLRPLCPTRWTTRFESIDSLLENYDAVMSTLSSAAENDRSEVGTRLLVY